MAGRLFVAGLLVYAFVCLALAAAIVLGERRSIRRERPRGRFWGR